MGNEMGNNNTSGLRKEDNTIEDKSVQEFDHADDPNFHEQKTEDKEEDNIKTEGKKSPEDAVRTNHEVVSSEDIYVNGKDRKEEDNDMIPVDKESSMQEAGYAEGAKGQDHLIPAAEDKNTRGNEMESASLEHDGLASPHIEVREHDEKEIEEMPMKEGSSTDETEAEAHLVSTGGDESTHGTETQLVFGDRGGMEYPCVDKQKHDEKGEDITVNDEAEEQSSQESASTDVLDRQGQLLAVVEDKSTHGNEIGFISSDPQGTTDLHGDNPKEHEKEEDNNMIPVDKVNSMQEAGYAEEAKGQDHLVPAAEDKNTRANEMESASLEHDGLASPCIEDPEHVEKEQDTSTILEVEEIPSKEAASTDETNAEARLVPTGGDESIHGTETGLVFGDRDGMEYPCADKQKRDEKEEDITINDEAEEQSSQEAASTDVFDRQGQLPVTVEDKTTHGKETGLVSTDPKGTTNLHGDNPKEREKEVNNTNAEPQEKPLEKDEHEDDIEEKNPTIHAAEGEDYNSTEAGSDSGDPVLVGDTLDNQTLKGQEQGKTELDPPAESTEDDAKPSEVVEGSETPPASSSTNLEDLEIQKESNSEENLCGRTHHENQNPLKEEDEGTSNSISGAESSTSHDSVPQEPIVVLEAEEHESAKIRTEKLVLECNGPLKSEDMIIPTLTSRDQENGFVLDSSVSTDPVESVFPDQSSETGKGRDEFLVEEMANKEVSSEEKFELRDGYEPGNDIGTMTIVMTDLPTEFGTKCNGELPSEMNSTKNDSLESQVEAVLSDETQSIMVEVSEPESEDKGIVLSQKGASVKEESENGNAKQSHCQTRSGEESIENSNGQGSEEGSKADDQSAFSPQFMMMLDDDCDSNEDCQFLQAKILENGHLIDASINYQNGQQKDSQQEVQLVTDSAGKMPADTFLMDQIYKEEESEKKIIEEMVESKKDSNPIENDTQRIENGEQCISHSYDPVEQAEEFLSPSPFLQALPGKQMQESDMEFKNVGNSNESMAEVKQESSGGFSITEASSFVTKNLTEKIIVSIVEFGDEKPLWDLSESSKSTPLTMAETTPSVKQCSEQCANGEAPEVIANGDYKNQRENVGRLSIESNPDSTTINAQMRKSPSFDLDLRIDARALDSDQTPLLYQDKATIDSFSSQADVTDPGKPEANNENGETPSQYESMAAKEKDVTLERSDSEKSKTPFLGFLKKEEEDADNDMLMNPKKQDNQSATKNATAKVSAKDVSSVTTKSKVKRKPRTSLFGTCMCCATV